MYNLYSEFGIGLKELTEEEVKALIKKIEYEVTENKYNGRYGFFIRENKSLYLNRDKNKELLLLKDTYYILYNG